LNDLLDFAQLEQSSLRLELISGGALLYMALCQLHTQIERERASISSDTLPAMLVDPTKMSRVLRNLISNAIKYRHADRTPKVHISCKQADAELQIAVSDNGCGIPDDQRDSVFELYRRLHGKDVAGSGIGLSVCRRIVERHGGRIWIESVPGQGSTVYFTIPGGS
jgi:signal transduction histidine kinase